MSRLIDGGPDRVEFWPQVMAPDAYGTPRPTHPGPPMVLQVQLQRVSSDEADVLSRSSTSGGPVRAVYRFSTARALPAHAGALVRAWGRDWEVLGEPTTQGRTSRTRHTRVVIRATSGQP